MSISSLFDSLLEVTLMGILLGAGLPTLFALGVRLSTPAHPAEDTAEDPGSAHYTSRPLAAVCFTVIGLAVIAGIFWITKSTLYLYFGWDFFGTEAGA